MEGSEFRGLSTVNNAGSADAVVANDDMFGILDTTLMRLGEDVNTSDTGSDLVISTKLVMSVLRDNGGAVAVCVTGIAALDIEVVDRTVASVRPPSLPLASESSVAVSPVGKDTADKADASGTEVLLVVALIRLSELRVVLKSST